MKLLQYDHLPAGLLQRPAHELHDLLGGPALIHLEGKDPRPLFVSVLQHGNETTGWEAIRRLLKSHFEYNSLPRSLSLFIGNTRAAKHRLRHLDDQFDYNRCWPGGKYADTEVGKLFREVTERMRSLRPIASMDIHNNTGLNPHYAAINRVAPEFLRLASYFSSKVVYFTIPAGTQSMAFANFCPATTLECGRAERTHGIDHSVVFMETCLHLDEIPRTPVSEQEVHLYHMVATVRIPDDVLFGFGNVPTDIALRSNLDSFNFHELPAGVSWGDIHADAIRPLLATNVDGADVTDDYFRFDRGLIETRRVVMPSMLTLDRRVIHQDCLCYLMEPVPFEDYAESTEKDVLPEGLHRSDRPGDPLPGQ